MSEQTQQIESESHISLTYLPLSHSLRLVFFSDECGIVAQISQPLADSDISAYYISTFSFDHALVSHFAPFFYTQRFSSV